ncbi:hypothetical protein FRC00_001036 [Tulasnella sp. 408]|nr:hypothetical protein FRC00_001036 [Tulasnella sp. 408]
MSGTEPHAKGGEGVIVVGTVIPPQEFLTWLPEIKVAVKQLTWNRNDIGESTKFFKVELTFRSAVAILLICRQSFVHELSLMATLSHPNVIKLIGFVEDMQQGDAWIVVPLEENGNVQEFLQRGEWDIPERISLIQDVICGVKYLHTNQPPICHGDLKSLNILVNSSYHAVITDFGSARFRRNIDKTENPASDLPGQTSTNHGSQESMHPDIKFSPSTSELTLTGPAFSLRWTAPEVLGDGTQDLPSDMWAMGWICWEIVTGKVPFNDLQRATSIISYVITGKLPAIREDSQLSHGETVGSETGSLQPSTIPSSQTSEGSKVRSAALLNELGTMYLRQNRMRVAQSYFLSAIDAAKRTGNNPVKASAFMGLGHTYRASSKNKDAIQAFQRSYDVCSLTGDDAGAANALEGLGESYRAQSSYDEAERALREAYGIHSRIGDKLGAANALNGLGYIYRVRARHEEAEQAFTEAHNIHSDIGNDMGTANALSGLGETYCALSKHEEAEKALKEAHKIHSLIGNDLGTANAFWGLGETYRARLMINEAENALKEAQKIHVRIGNDLGLATTLTSLGEIYRAQGRYNDGEKAFTDARKIHSRIGDGLGEANALCGLGQMYRAQAKDEHAYEAFKEAHRIHSHIGDDLGIANAWNGLGEVYQTQSRFGDAEEAFRHAHEIHSRIGNAVGEANVLCSLGQVYRSRGMSSEAEKAFKDAHTIHSSIDHHLGTGNALRSIGMLYSDQSKYTDAKEAYYQALTAYAVAGNHDSRARTLLALGEAHRAQGEYPKAEDSVEEALAIWVSLSNDQDQAVAALILSGIFESQSKYDEQLTALLRAERAFTRVGNDELRESMRRKRTMVSHIISCLNAQREFSLHNNRRGEATQLCNLGGLFSLQGQHEKAEQYFIRASITFADIPDDAGRVRALDGLMGLYTVQGKMAEAKATCEDAREIYTRMGLPMSELCEMTWIFVQD